MTINWFKMTKENTKSQQRTSFYFFEANTSTPGQVQHQSE